MHLDQIWVAHLLAQQANVAPTPSSILGILTDKIFKHLIVSTIIL
jgi:hypothetical protein